MYKNEYEHTQPACSLSFFSRKQLGTAITDRWSGPGTKMNHWGDWGEGRAHLCRTWILAGVEIVTTEPLGMRAALVGTQVRVHTNTNTHDLCARVRLRKNGWGRLGLGCGLPVHVPFPNIGFEPWMRARSTKLSGAEISKFAFFFNSVDPECIPQARPSRTVFQRVGDEFSRATRLA